MQDIDIVIPTAGRLPDLLQLLRSLREHAAASWTSCVASVTVSDDRHSTAVAQALAAEFPAVRYTPGPARGPAANRNHGARQGRAEWLLFLDDDCFVRADLIDAYARARVARPEMDVLEGAIHAVGGRPNGNHHAPLNLSGGCLWSCNLMVRRALFEQLGRFDERFPYASMEDTDLRERLQNAGASIDFVGDAIVFHPWRTVSEREVTRAIISHAIYAQKHPRFVGDWNLRHLLLAMRGRVHQYRLGRFTSIPLRQYPAVVYDFLAPVLLYAMMRAAPVREWLSERHRNRAAGKT